MLYSIAKKSGSRYEIKKIRKIRGKYGCSNVRKHIEIDSSDKYVTLGEKLNIGSLDKMIITSSDPKDNLGRSGKGLITYLGLKAKTRPKK